MHWPLALQTMLLQPTIAAVFCLRLPQFGMYIMFPIGIMFYYGHNLDKRFQVPDFWPKPEQTHKIPFERDEIKGELDRLRAKRLYLREQRLKREQALGQNQE